MVWFQKISIHLTEGHWRFWSRGGLAVHIQFKVKNEVELEFPDGENHPVKGVWVFSEAMYRYIDIKCYTEIF